MTSAVPTLTPVTTPDELTVATAMLDDVHVPPGSPLDDIAVVFPTQTDELPLKEPAFAPVETVILKVAELFAEQGAVALTV